MNSTLVYSTVCHVIEHIYECLLVTDQVKIRKHGWGFNTL